MSTPSKPRRRALQVMAALAALAIGFIVLQVTPDGDSLPGEMGAVEREAKAFVAHLRAGNREQARAMWSSELRDSSVPEEVAERLTPEVRASDWVRFTTGQTTDTKACVGGGLGTDGLIVDSVSHSFRVYCVREDGRWRIDAAQMYENGAAAPKPPWPSSWHAANDRAHKSMCASGY